MPNATPDECYEYVRKKILEAKRLGYIIRSGALFGNSGESRACCAAGACIAEFFSPNYLLCDIARLYEIVASRMCATRVEVNSVVMGFDDVIDPQSLLPEYVAVGARLRKEFIDGC